MKAIVVFAHGAGAGMSSPFMQNTRDLFHSHGIACRLFNFDYMVRAEAENKRRPPDRMDKLQACFLRELAEVAADIPVIIGGKSMGGRVASMLLESSDAIAGICFGYPFHPPGKPEKLRTQHLHSLHKPLLIVQGERDPFGKHDEVIDYALPKNIRLEFVKNGEHSFKTRKSDDTSDEQNMQDAVARSVDFINSITNN